MAVKAVSFRSSQDHTAKLSAAPAACRGCRLTVADWRQSGQRGAHRGGHGRHGRWAGSDG
eukprot:2942049-Prymnesium_polylepis.1